MADPSQSTGLQPASYSPEMDIEEPLPFRAFTRRRLLTALAVVLAVIALVVLPPLLNVGRYKRQIASSISASLGRPVHIDNVTLNLLPLPGFTLERFVVGEDPAFGAEPVLRADEVRATLRVASLWRRRLEFSRISLTDPSINLVHLPDGRWNLESIFIQASHISAAPTAQRSSGGTPRFPYIEASGARINLKLGMEKTPFSLTDADAALWLPEPGQWHVRLKAHPARTDTAVSDTGVLRLDGTLGQASTLADVPLNVHADWTAAPLGALSWIVMGRDAGLRGVMSLHAGAIGTLGKNAVDTQFELENVRRAEFVPRHSLAATITCTLYTSAFFRALDAGRCLWPADTEGSGLRTDFRIPDLARPSAVSGTIQLHNVPASTVLEALHSASNRISPDLEAGGLISATLPCCSEQATATPVPLAPVPPPTPVLQVTDATLSLPEQPSFLHGPVSATLASAPGIPQTLRFAPIPLDLGGSQPALLLLTLARSGASLQLVGEALPARLHLLAAAFPQFGDGLDQVLPAFAMDQATTPISLNLNGEHRWESGQNWTVITVPSAAVKRSTHASRRSRGASTRASSR